MPRIETTLLDRFVNGAFAGKRKIGRPLKANIRHKGYQGWIELVFNPRTRLEQYVSECMRMIHPYLFFITYRFHVEKAREAGKYKFYDKKSNHTAKGEVQFKCCSPLRRIRLKK